MFSSNILFIVLIGSLYTLSLVFLLLFFVMNHGSRLLFELCFWNVSARGLTFPLVVLSSDLSR